MKSTKKLLSLLLVLAMVFSLAVPVFAEGETPTTATLASWSGGTSLTNNGENDILKDVTLVMKDNGEGLNQYNSLGVTTSTFGNLSAQPWYATGFSAINYGYIEFTAATKGYESLNLTTVLGSNGKAPTSYSVMFSVDGGNTWTVVETKLTAPAEKANKLEKATTSTVAVPAEAADTDSVMFRIKQDVAANGAGNIGGNLYIYSIALTGTEKSPDTTPSTTPSTTPTDPPVDPPEPGELEGKTVILHSNDVHGAIAGYANMAALAADYEAKGANVIIADAGDYSQGTTYVSTSKGLEAVNMMNAAGYDIATLGNHEFDYGYAKLTENLKSAKFDVVCCNILDADGNLVFAPSKVVEVDGVKIGFIGVNTPESQTKANPALIKGLKWLSGEDMVKAVQAEADKLADTVDVTVVLAHLGVDDSSVPNTSYDLFKGLNGVDFIIDGHSHTVMDKGAAEEPIQSTGTAFENIGVIVIDNEKKAIESNKLVEITAESPADVAVAAAAQAIIDKINAEYGVVFAKSEVDLNGARTVDENGVYGNRDGETNLGDLITDSMMWQVKKNLDGITVPEENIVAITNGGGIRASIAKGDITKKDVNTVLPFGNTIAVVYVTGAELLEALEASTYCTPVSLGGFPQVAGIEMTVSVTVPYDANDNTYPGSTYYGPKSINRVTIDSINGKAFDPEATYAVITNNFLAAGGDTYYAFASATAQFDTGIPLDEALMSYITEELKGVVGKQYAAPQGRITIHECDFEDGHGTCTVCGFTPFSDISNSGYCDYIVVGYLAGIINGYEDGTFRPNNTVTRGQFITMLWRAVGEPGAENTTLNFKDAANIPDAYKDAVAWGVEAGIIKGYDDDTFRPNQSISRAQMATFSYRLLVLTFGEEAIDEFNQPCGFKDAATVADPYVDAVNVCANLGIILGFDTDGDGEGDTFRPNDTANRGQAATIILRVVVVIDALAGALE